MPGIDGVVASVLAGVVTSWAGADKLTSANPVATINIIRFLVFIVFSEFRVRDIQATTTSRNMPASM
jgi:hypothetical protein